MCRSVTNTPAGCAIRSMRSSSRGSKREGLQPSPRSDRATLIRRVTLDLTGLPPTPAEVDAFLADSSAGRLRERGRSPAGLAALRRADGHPLARRGALRRHQRLPDRRRAHMWRWRDWVIDAFNRNLPFDQFTIEQLAGDLLAGRHARSEDRHRLQPQPSRQRRGRHHSGGVRRRVRRRSRRDDGHGLAGPDDGLRPLSRPQVRSDHAEGVLPALRVLQQRAGTGQGRAGSGNSPPFIKCAHGAAGTAAAGADRKLAAAKTLAALEPELARAQQHVGADARYHRARACGTDRSDWSPTSPLDGSSRDRVAVRATGSRSRRAWWIGEPQVRCRPHRWRRRLRRQAAQSGGDVADSTVWLLRRKFSLAAWIYSGGGRAAPSSRRSATRWSSTDAGYTCEGSGKVQLNCVRTWLDDVHPR